MSYPDVESHVKEMSNLSVKKAEEMAIKNIYPTTLTVDLPDDRCRYKASFINTKTKELQQKCLHYKKIKEKWIKAKTVVRILGTGIGVVLVIGSSAIGIATSSGVLIPAVLPIILGTIGTLQASSSEIFSLSLMKSKIAKYRKKEELLNKFINRLHHFYSKATNDRVITDEELNEFEAICSEFDNASSFIKEGEEEKDSVLDLKKLKKQAYKEGEQEAKKEVLERLKKKRKEEVIQSVA